MNLAGSDIQITSIFGSGFEYNWLLKMRTQTWPLKKCGYATYGSHLCKNCTYELYIIQFLPLSGYPVYLWYVSGQNLEAIAHISNFRIFFHIWIFWIFVYIWSFRLSVHIKSFWICISIWSFRISGKLRNTCWSVSCCPAGSRTFRHSSTNSTNSGSCIALRINLYNQERVLFCGAV